MISTQAFGLQHQHLEPSYCNWPNTVVIKWPCSQFQKVNVEFQQEMGDIPKIANRETFNKWCITELRETNREKCYPPGLVTVGRFTTPDLKGQGREWLLESHLTYRWRLPGKICGISLRNVVNCTDHMMKEAEEILRSPLSPFHPSPAVLSSWKQKEHRKPRAQLT